MATRLWPTMVGFSILALAATVSNQPGRYVGDNRFDQFWNPGLRAARQFLIWDPLRGLGREREDFWPGATWPLAWLRGVGLDPFATQRLWHAAVLVGVGVGMVAVLRLLRPRIGPEHLLAGLVAMFSAYAATFLVPSNLAVNFALAPWMIVIFVRGVVGGQPWRWAGAFALVVFAGGNADPPGLVLAATPLLAVAVYLVFVERAVRLRTVLAWCACAGVLSVGAAAAALVKLWIASGPFSQRLGGTELPEVSSTTSSWSESLRGLGNWRSYFVDVIGPTLPQGFPYFNNPFVIVATVAVPVVALLTLARSAWRPRLLFGLMMLLSVVLMVAAFPLDDPAPLGRGLLSALTNVEVLGSLRNTYKAGAGLVLGSSALFGIGVVGVVRWLAERRRSWAVAFGIAMAGVVVLAAFPFWSGRLYDPRTTLDSVPEYWDEAFAYLDDVQGDSPGGAALVLPGAGRAPYRWGWPGDDLYEASTSQPVVERIGVPLSAPLSANLVDALAVAANDPVHQPGTLGPALRRLGITHVVVRNDLRWGGRVGPRPAAYAGLRTDPDLMLAASFGVPGENTTAVDDESALAAIERDLPPVEIYEVVGAPRGLRAPATLPPLVVSGDGEAWVPLAAAGRLDGDRPVLYSASASSDQLVPFLDAGAGVVVTDTSRRQLRVQIAYDPDVSYLLADGQSLDRPLRPLFDEPGSQSVAWYPDAVTISADGPPRGPTGTQGWIRPSNATDGDPGTEWIASAFDGPLRRTLTVELRQPTIVDRISLIEARTASEPLLTGATVGFSDGSTVEVPMRDGRGELRFPPRTTSSVTVRAAELPEVDGEPIQPLGVGFADIAIGDLDLREFVQVPDDLARRAETDPTLAAALARSPFSFLFTRREGSEFLDPTANPLASDPVRNQLESVMLRRFRTPGAASWSIEGVVRADAAGLPAASTEGIGDNDGTGRQADALSPFPSCVDVGLRVGGDAVPIRVTDSAPPARDGSGRVRFAGCGNVDLLAGWHLLEAGRSSGVDTVELRSGPPLADESAVALTLDSDAGVGDPAGSTARIVAPDGGVVSSGQGWDPRWRASLDGVDLGPPLALDTFAAWVVPATDGGTLRLVLGPTGWFDASLVVSGLSVALCLWLILRRPAVATRGHAVVAEPSAGPTRAMSTGATAVSAAVASAAALVVIGWWALPVVAVVVAGSRWWRSRAASLLFTGAAVSLAAAAVVTITNARWGSASVLSPSAPGNALATLGGRVSGAFFVAALVLAVAGDRVPALAGSAGAARVSPSVASLRVAAERARRVVAEWRSIGVLGVLTAAGVVWRGATALPGGLAAAVDDLRSGLDPAAAVGAALGSAEGVTVAPLGPLVVALSPLPTSWLSPLVAAALVLVAGRAGWWLRGRWSRCGRGGGAAHRWSLATAGLAAAVVVALLPSLPWLIASTALVGAVLLADPVRLDGRREVAAGLGAGLAVLAVPATLAVVVVLVGWVALVGHRRWGAVVTAAVAAALVAPWAVWALGSVGWAASTDVWVWTAAGGFAALLAVIVAALLLVLALWWRRGEGTEVAGSPK